MTAEETKSGEYRESLGRKLKARQARKLKAMRRGDRSVWFGLGMFGLFGWSVSIPAVLMTLLGVWLDQTYRGGISWTLTLLGVGFGLGLLNALRWVSKERKSISEECGDDDECAK